MTPTHTRIRLAVPGDCPRLSELFTAQYDQHKPESYFLWQFFESPFSPRLAVAEVGTDLVGAFGGIERPLSNGMRAVQAVDMLIDQEFRGIGLFLDLASFCLAGFTDPNTAVVLSNRAGTAAVTRRLGWTNLGMVPQYVWSPGTPPATPAALPPNPAPLPCVPPAVRGERIEFAYGPEVIAWRFGGHPVHAYTELRSGTAVGWVKTFSSPSRPDRVFGDVLCVSATDSQQRVQWLRGAQAWYAGRGQESLALWAVPGSAMAAAAVEAGFAMREQERWFCCHPIGPESARLADLSRWDLCAADAEHY